MIVGAGLTVIVNFIPAPLQPLAVGITATVSIRGTMPLFTAVKDAMSPDPLAGSPMPEFVFVQLNVAPADPLLKFTAATASPLHTA